MCTYLYMSLPAPPTVEGEWHISLLAPPTFEGFYLAAKKWKKWLLLQP